MPNTDATLCYVVTIFRTETPEFGVISITNIDTDLDADILSHLMTEFPELQQLTYKLGVAKTEHDATTTPDRLTTCHTDEADGETKPTADLKVDFDGDMYTTPKPAPRSVARGKIGVKAEPAEEGEEGEAQGGYHGLEDMNLDEAIDAEACDEEGSEDGMGSIGKYEDLGELMVVDDLSLHDGEAAMMTTLGEPDHGEGDPEDGTESDSLAPCTTTTSGRKSTRQMTLEEAREKMSKFHAGSNPQYAIVGKMKEAGASGTSGRETIKAMVIGYMAHDSGLPIDQIQAPASLPLDDPTAVALIKAVFEFWGPRYNNFSFDPEALSTLFANLFTEDPKKHAGPKQLFPKKDASLPRDFYDINITLGTGAFYSMHLVIS
jgi:hypothetical protein